MGRRGKSRQVTMGNLSEVVMFELRHPMIRKSGGTGFQTEEITRVKTCVGVSLAFSRVGGKTGRFFPGINSYHGVTEPKVIDIFITLDIHIYW